MATVKLRAPLRDLAGGNTQVTIDGATVGDVIRSLETTYPRVSGWILDEQGHVRQHVNVFLNGERIREDAQLHPDDVIHVLPSISGGGAR
jgi:sulfur-carrier protein